MKSTLIIIFFTVISFFSLQSQNLWNIQPDGSISWTVKKGEAHSDNIEMSGRFMSDEELLFNF
jgi:hypothetical protein